MPKKYTLPSNMGTKKKDMSDDSSSSEDGFDDIALPDNAFLQRGWKNLAEYNYSCRAVRATPLQKRELQPFWQVESFKNSLVFDKYMKELKEKDPVKHASYLLKKESHDSRLRKA